MRWRRILAWTSGGILAAGLLLFASLQTAIGQRELARLAMSLASSDDSKVEIVGLGGFFPTDFHVKELTVSDRHGLWLHADDAQIRWSFASLFTGRVRIDEIFARRIDVLRAPQTEKKTDQSSSGGLGLPGGVDLRKLDVPDIHVGSELAGVDSRWKLGGSLLLAADGTESRLKFALDRTDGPVGHIASDLAFDLAARSAQGQLTIEEPNRGGMVATLTGLPELDHVSARIEARGGTMLAFGFSAEQHVNHARATAAGTYDLATDKLDAKAQLEMAGGVDWRDLRLELQAKLAGLRTQPSGSASVTASAEDVTYGGVGPTHVDLVAKLGLLRDGRVAVESLDFTSSVANIKGTGSYRLATQAGDARLAIDAADLAALSKLAGTPLEGRTHVDLTLNTSRTGLGVSWQGTIDDLSVPGVPRPLVQQNLRLSGKGLYKKDGKWQLDKAQVASERATFDLSGHGAGSSGELALSVALPDLAQLQPGVTGSGTVKASLGYGADEVHGKVSADGTVADQPLALSVDFSRKSDGSLRVPAAQGRWASASVDVRDLTVTPRGTMGSGHLSMSKLEDLAPVLGVKVAGAFDLDVASEPDPNGKLRVALKGERLRGEGLAAADLTVDGTVSDPLGRAETEAAVKVTGLGGVDGVGQVSATVKGDHEAMDVTLNAAGQGMNAALAAKVEAAGDEVRIGLQRLAGKYREIPVVLSAPAKVRIAGPRTTIEPASLSVGNGKVAISGALDGGGSDLTIQIAQLPLALVETFSRGTKLEGSLQARLHVTGALAHPRVQATYSVAGLRLKEARAALVPAVAVQGSATLAGEQATFDANLSAGGATRLSLKGDGALSGKRAKVAIRGGLDLAPFAAALGTDVRGVAGTLRPDLVVTLNGESLSGSGTIALAGGALYLPDTGLRLTNGQGNMILQGETLQIQRLSFQTAKNGELSASGTLRLDKDMPVDIAVTTRKALIVNRPDLVATVSSDVRLSGSQGAGLQANGTITVDRAELAVGLSQAANYPVLPVREINGTSPSAALVPAAQPKKPQPRASPLKLALKVVAPQAVFVRGRGLNAEVGGQFTVTGNPTAPSVLGSLTLRRGTFDLAGHILDFSRGNVSLVDATTIDPQIDFAATTSVSSTTIEVDITGSPRAPKIALTSSPPLSQDEAMAMLLFGKPASGLTASELLMAAQALAELSGGTPVGGGFMGRVRSVLGLDQLAVNPAGTSSGPPGSSSSSGTSVQGGRYVAPGVYVGAEQGTSTTSSRGVVQIEVLKHTKIEGAVGADSNDRIGAKMEWDY